MDFTSPYYSVKWNKNVIQEAKTKSDNRNARYDFNNMEHETKFRHIGFLGEWAFGNWLHDWKVPATMVSGDVIDYLDFKVKRTTGGIWGIEVKTSHHTKDYNITPYFDCFILEDQVEKMRPDDYPVDIIVFAKHVVPTDTTVLVGWITKKDFYDKMVYMPKGTMIGKGETAFPLSTADYRVKIKDLKGMDILHRNL